MIHASAFVNPRSARFIGYFAARGYDVQAITTAPQGHAGIDLNSVLDGNVKHNVRSVLLPPWRGGLTRQIFDRAWFIIAAARAIRLHQPHGIVATDVEGLLSAMLARPGKAFVIYDIRDSTKVKFYRLPQFVANILAWVESLLVKHVDAVIIVDRRRAVELPGKIAAHPHLEVIENYASDSSESVQRVARVAQPNELQVCLCGYLIPQRGVDWALRSVEKCSGIRLVVYGTPAHGIVAERIRNRPNVSWLGNLDHQESLAHMAASDLVLALYDPTVAGHRIAAPGKLYEAFMLGRPVVVNRGTSLEGMVEGDRAGYVIDYDLNDALRRCLLVAAGERLTRLPELGRNARAAFESKYNWNICKARLDALVDRAAGTPGR